MHFVPPEGATLVLELATGSIFHVALVRVATRTVVCKRLTSRGRDEPAARIAIVREAMLLSRMRIAAVPSFFRVGTDDHGPFVLEEFVEGMSFRALVEAWRQRGERVPPRLVAYLAVAAAEALAGLHGLKPPRRRSAQVTGT